MPKIQNIIYRSDNGKLDAQASLLEGESFEEASLKLQEVVEAQAKQLIVKPTESLEEVVAKVQEETRKEVFNEIYEKLGIKIPEVVKEQTENVLDGNLDVQVEQIEIEAPNGEVA